MGDGLPGVQYRSVAAMATRGRSDLGPHHIWYACLTSAKRQFWDSTDKAYAETKEPTNGVYNWSVSALTFNISTWEIFYFWLYLLNVSQGSSSLDTPPIKSHDFILRDPDASSSSSA